MYLRQNGRKFYAIRLTFGEGGGDGGSPGTGTPPDTGASKEQENKEKKFSQAELNLFLSRKENEFKTQMQELQSNLEALRETSVAPEVKEELTKQISSLEAKTKTQAELAKRNEENLKRQHQEQLVSAQKDASEWRDRFTQMKIRNDMFLAAGDDAKNPEHIVQILGTKVYLDPEKLETRVKMSNDKGEEMDMSPSEAMTIMKEDVSKFGYLFKSTSKGGLGADKAGGDLGYKGGFSKDPATFSKQFKQFRKENGIV